MNTELRDGKKNSKMKSFILYFVISMICVYISSIYLDKRMYDISSLNIVLNIIAIPSCVIYYKKTKNITIFIYLLIYISTLIENSYVYLANVKTRIIAILFIYRTFLLAITIEDNKISRYIEKNRRNVVIFTTFFNLIILPMEEVISKVISPEESMNAVKVLVILSYVVILKLVINAYKRRDFVECVFVFGIILMGVRLWLVYIIEKSIVLNEFIPSNEVLFLLTYISILIGLFIENGYMVNENESLKELEELRIQFFANLSHELKTPINIIYSSVQLLETKKSNSKEFIEVYNKYEPTLKQNCFRMIRLTNNLVDMTKINAGYMSLNFRNVDIVNLVEEITMSVVNFVEQKNIKIIFDTMIEEHIIKCNIDAIERIILNLLSNAIKFSGESGEILVLIEQEEGYIVIRVKDNGAGIAKEDRNNIFGVFIQVDKAFNRSNEGSGIGLSLVKSLVELHGGIVYFEDIDQGTEVVVKIPDVKLEGNNDIDEFNREIYNGNLVSKINVEFSDIYDIK